MTAGSGGPWPFACAAHAVARWRSSSPTSLFLGHVPYFRDVSQLVLPELRLRRRRLAPGRLAALEPDRRRGRPVPDGLSGRAAPARRDGRARRRSPSPALHVWLAMCGATLLARDAGLAPRRRLARGGGLRPLGLPPVVAQPGAALARRGLGPVGARGATCAAERPAGPPSAGLLGARWPRCRSARCRGRDRRCRPPCSRSSSHPSGRALPHLRALGAAALLSPRCSPRRCSWGRARSWRARPGREGFAAGAVALLVRAPRWCWPEAVWPRFLGDPHTMTDLGFWGQPFFPDGYPYFVSLYLGPLVLALALCAGRRDPAAPVGARRARRAPGARRVTGRSARRSPVAAAAASARP